jgi:hypothetical protein
LPSLLLGLKKEMPAPTPMCDTAESTLCARASAVRIAAVMEKQAIWMSRMLVFVMRCDVQGSNRLSRSLGTDSPAQERD